LPNVSNDFSSWGGGDCGSSRRWFAKLERDLAF